jgi:hypothetical protein
VLDVAFREDVSRVRKDHAPANFAILRHMALNMLKQEKSAKVGIQAKRVTVPKLVIVVRSAQKWGTVAQYPHFFMEVLYRMPYFRPEVGEIVRNEKALPNLERSPKRLQAGWDENYLLKVLSV